MASRSLSDLRPWAPPCVRGPHLLFLRAHLCHSGSSCQVPVARSLAFFRC